MRRQFAFVLLTTTAIAALLTGCGSADVTLYCGVDQDQSRQIADLFAEESSLKVAFQGETEAMRSIGLPQKLLGEQKNPRADVFWSNEIMSMIDLSIRGLIDDLPPGVADAFPPEWRDPQGRYVAFGARARILLVNKELLPDKADWPKSVEDLLDPKYHKMGLFTCMARPLTGTTYTHAVAMLTRDTEGGKAFLENVVAASNEGRLKLVASNGRAMQAASDAKTKVAFCLTDTDDAWKAIERGDPVEVVYPDQGAGEVGAVLIPNTVGIVKGGPQPDNAAKLLAWLASAENEVRLAKGPSAQIPLRLDLGDAELPAHVKRPRVDFRATAVDWQKVGENKERWIDYLTRHFQAPE